MFTSEYWFIRWIALSSFCTTGTWPQLLKRVNSTMHWINLCPVNDTFGLPNTYPLDSDLSSGQHYPAFKQPGTVQERICPISVIVCIMLLFNTLITWTCSINFRQFGMTSVCWFFMAIDILFVCILFFLIVYTGWRMVIFLRKATKGLMIK